MIVYFKCHLADGSDKSHTYELRTKTLAEAIKFIDLLTSAIASRLEQGRCLIMPSPATYYAPGWVRYVEIDFADDAKELEESTREEFKRKMGFVKEQLYKRFTASKLKGGLNGLYPKDILAVWLKCNKRCVYGECIPVKLEDYGKTWEIDHATPGGADDLNNQLVACIKHNRQKGDQTEAEFRRWLRKNPHENVCGS